MSGASGCATATEIAEGVTRILRRDALVPPTRAVMALEARVEPIAGKKRYRATIDIADADGSVKGTRKLESPGDDCRRLDEPAALAIALMIDPDALQPPPPPPPAPVVPIVAVRRDILIVPVPVTITQPAPPPITNRIVPRMTPELTLSLGPTVAFGVVPGPSPGLRFGVEVGPPAELSGGHALTIAPSSIRVGFATYSGSIAVTGESPAQSASLSMVALLPQIALCPATVWLGARAAFAACLAVDVGAITWTGDGFDSSVAEDARPFVDLGPVAQARVVVVEPFALELRGGAVVPFVRDRFVYGLASGTSALAYEPGAVAATFDAALTVGLGL